jgi:hypothetical protein
LKSLETDDPNAIQMESKWNHNHNQNHNHTHKQIIRARINNNNNTHRPSPEFVSFWSVYPRKTGKGAAEKAWAKAVHVDDPETILKALRDYKFPDDPQFIPLPSTWLNQKRWLDEPVGAKVIPIMTDEERKAKIREIWKS